MKYYELKKGDKAKHGDEILIFQKIDGIYIQWRTLHGGDLRIGNALEYELRDGIYYPN